MVRFVDIDGTICRTTGTDYENALPNDKRIDVVNAWYDAGDTIVYWTSRGMGKDRTPCDKIRIEALTKKQLHEWGCRYTELRMDKPVFDALYDDKATCCPPAFFKSIGAFGD